MNPLAGSISVLLPALLSYVLAKRGREADGTGRVGYELGNGACWMLEYMVIQQHLLAYLPPMDAIGVLGTSALVAGLVMIIVHVAIRLLREDE